MKNFEELKVGDNLWSVSLRNGNIRGGRIKSIEPENESSILISAEDLVIRFRPDKGDMSLTFTELRGGMIIGEDLKELCLIAHSKIQDNLNLEISEIITKYNEIFKNLDKNMSEGEI